MTAALVYSENFSHAPKSGHIMFLVPTNSTEDPIAYELGQWNDQLKRWDGDWRYDTTDTNYNQSEPVAWAAVPAAPANVLKRAMAAAQKRADETAAQLKAALEKRAAAQKAAEEKRAKIAAENASKPAPKIKLKASTKDKETFDAL